MTHAPRNDAAALAGLALAGIAAYAGYRAIDAERRVKDPEAKPLIDHILETAKSDISTLRARFDECVQKATDGLKELGDEIEAKTADLRKDVADAVDPTHDDGADHRPA
jgi:hypothetical protein